MDNVTIVTPVTTSNNEEMPSVSAPVVSAPVVSAPAPLSMLPQFATTPKRGSARKPKREPSILLAYAIEHGGRVELTQAAKADLAKRGLPEHRIPCAIYDVRKYFGKSVTAERNGRAVAAYNISL